MDFSQLKTFVTVAHYGHLTQASETLHLSQPAVTAKIKSLEKSLNLELFARNAQGMQLTLAGKNFLPKAEKLLQEIHSVNVFAQNLAKEEKLPIVLGTTSSVNSTLLSQAAYQLQQALPHIYIQILNDIGGNILNQVRKKELLAGIYIGEVPYRNVFSHHIGEQEYCLISPQSWSKELIDTKTLSSKPWLDMSAFTSNSKATQNFFHKCRIKPNITMQCDHLNTLIALVSEKAGLALVPKKNAIDAQQAGFKIDLLPEYKLSLPVQFIYHMELELDPTLKTLREITQHLV